MMEIKNERLEAQLKTTQQQLEAFKNQPQKVSGDLSTQEKSSFQSEIARLSVELKQVLSATNLPQSN